MYDPQIGKSPKDWAEEEARRKERREPLDNPYGRPVSPMTRRVLGWILVALVVAMIVTTVLGLLGVIGIFAAPSA